MHASIAALIEDAHSTGSLPDAVLAIEARESGRSPDEIRGRIRDSLQIMRRAVDEGLEGDLRSPSGLTGGRAARLAAHGPRLLGDRVTAILSRAIATLEVNAAMGLIVAAPGRRRRRAPVHSSVRRRDPRRR